MDAVASETGDMGMGELGCVMVVYWFQGCLLDAEIVECFDVVLVISPCQAGGDFLNTKINYGYGFLVQFMPGACVAEDFPSPEHAFMHYSNGTTHRMKESICGGTHA